MTKVERFSVLRQKLDTYFSIGELKNLCFDLGIDYDNIPGGTKQQKARELVSWAAQNNRISDLVAHCSELRPHATWAPNYQAKIFLSYSRQAKEDAKLVEYLYQTLTEHGHQVFIDTGMRSGTQWLVEVDHQIQRADLIVVLLSPESARSEMLEAQVQRAYEYRQRHGRPKILLIRLNYEDLVPYPVAAFINTRQYVIWQDETDNARVAEGIQAAINLELRSQPHIDFIPLKNEQVLSEDGLPMNDKNALYPPSPEFDPRLLEELVPPGGTVTLRDKFYVERRADYELRRQLLRPGTITTIQASRQTGKSSLLVRGIHHARQQGRKIVHLDLQRIDREDLVDRDRFLQYLATYIIRKLQLDQGQVDKAWQSLLGPQDKLTYLMENYILPQSDQPLILAIDEADRLLGTDYHTGFFGLIRSWHNSAAFDTLWERLAIVLVISTEPYLLIDDVEQSPFNVGTKLYLRDFSMAQVQDLNQRHSSPVVEKHFTEFMELIEGHPYLTRKALYTFVVERLSWKKFTEVVSTDNGPFSDHLLRQLWLLRDEPELQTALQQVIYENRCDHEEARFRLLKAGLIKGIGQEYICRCDLYRRYFKDRLR